MLKLCKSHIENTTTKNIANQLNEYFTDVGNSVLQDLPMVSPALGETVNRSMFLYRTKNSSEVCSINGSLENNISSGDDELLSVIVKRTSNITVPFITDLLNQPFLQGVFPDILRKAKVIPVHEKGYQTDEDSYRPLSFFNV